MHRSRHAQHGDHVMETTIMSINRDSILAGASKSRTEQLHVPAWDCTIYVRGLTGWQRDSIEQEFAAARDGKRVINVRGRIVAWCVVDDAGRRVFTDADAQTLGQYDAVVLDPIASLALRLSGMTPEAIGDAEKN